jgi:hypothetical protein
MSVGHEEQEYRRSWTAPETGTKTPTEFLLSGMNVARPFLAVLRGQNDYAGLQTSWQCFSVCTVHVIVSCSRQIGSTRDPVFMVEASTSRHQVWLGKHPGENERSLLNLDRGLRDQH